MIHLFDNAEIGTVPKKLLCIIQPTLQFKVKSKAGSEQLSGQLLGPAQALANQPSRTCVTTRQRNSTKETGNEQRLKFWKSALKADQSQTISTSH